MRALNVEIFDRNMQYKSSAPAQYNDIKMDYLSIEKSTVTVSSILADEGDFIRICGKEEEYVGIVTGTKKTSVTDISFKPLMDLANVNVSYNKADLEEKGLEEWIAGIFNATYRDNRDYLQNIPGFRCEYEGYTPDAVISAEERVGNLYDILTEIFINYSVIVNFKTDFTEKEIVATVQKVQTQEMVIEADLPNILEKNIDTKKAEQSINKLVVSNKEDAAESVEFYMLTSGEISTSADAIGRITPVIFTSEALEYKENEEKTFRELAYEKAVGILVPPKYNNLIELKVEADDKMLAPKQMQIGQQVCIISAGVAYHTVLTGKRSGEYMTLIFGAVRLELSKKLKRRMGNDNT